MISTDLQRVQIQSIVENQLPSFVQEDFPLLGEFLKEYYVSQEYPGASTDLLQNIDEYLKLNSLTNNADYTELGEDIDFDDEDITVTFDLNKGIFGTYEFPERHGLIQIDNEIILYTEKTNTSFTGCVRGFSGVTSYDALDAHDQLSFSQSDANPHPKGSKVVNLSALFLNNFLIKLKKQISPGFEDRTLDADLNQKLFISRSKDFYQTKGTDESFKILFGALYGETVEVIKPREYLFRPSDAEYRVTKDLVVQSIEGDPLDLLNSTLYQDDYHAGGHYCIKEAYAPISGVEVISIGNSDFYKLNLDYGYAKDVPLKGSVYGEFTIHPNTKVIDGVSIGSSVIDVDSTLGFPESGELYAIYGTGVAGILTYRSKSINQFFGVGLANTTTVGINTSIDSEQDIRLNTNVYGYVGLGTTTQISMRVTGVLADPIIPDDTYYFDKNDTISIKSLGITTSSPKVDNWFYNVATKYDIESITLVDDSDSTYTLVTYAANNFRLGDKVTIIDNAGGMKDSTVSEVISAYSFSIKGQGVIVGSNYKVQRKILRGKVENSLSDYSYIDNYFANVQNTYVNFDQDVIVASSSIPNYYNSPLDFYDREITLNGEYSGDTFTILTVNDHGYYTGDAVYYNSYDIESEDFLGNTTKVVSKFPEMDPGVFFVKRVNKNQFQLATSPANISNNSFVSVSGIVTSNTLCPLSFYGKDVDHQLLLKEIKKPINEDGDYTTEPGSRTGILVNGVEILNYKSNETVHYGPIKNIDIAAEGRGYDIINPPILHISDNVGSGATGICAVEGVLRGINITDTGFDYVSKPTVTITGGNGTGATAKVNTKFIEHAVSFNATADAARVDITDSTIGFSTYHKFRNGEKVIYKTDGQTAVGGISTDAIYYVHTVGVSTIKLYTSETDAVKAGINTVALSSFGVGVQRIQSYDKKQIISNVVVGNPGSGYQNKKRTIVSSTGINTALNQININDHGYKSGEIIQYSYNVDQITGINSNTNYVVTAVDGDNFKLSSVGVGSTSKFLYYDSEQYIQLNVAGLGTGVHTFNYEPIVVSLSGEIGVKTESGQDFKAKLQPLFKGSLDSVQVTSEGSQYGSSDIINYDRQPLLTLHSGSGAEITAIINNGKIVEAQVDNQGEGYNAPPELVVTSTSGYHGKLVPIINDGKITSVRVDNPGIGYTGSVGVAVTVDASNGRLRAKIQTWTVNVFQKSLDIMSGDDGILDAAENTDLGIEYTHVSAPRKLRESLYVRDQDNNIKYGLLDLQKIDDEEVAAEYHSPIIGWAYDGNPIYGPYGYSTRTGGSIRAMESGYEAVTVPNRPPLSTFPQGFFVEDFEFKNSGDLDDHNGRFCVTPDYPNGVYAYFGTINPTSIENSGPFNKYRLPEFPYLIGNSFKSKPNSFNYNATIDQQSYNLNNTSYFRNTTPYSLTEPYAYYDFLYQPNKEKKQLIDINHTSLGSIDKVGILTGGNNYQVNDTINFEQKDEYQRAKGRVSQVVGKVVTNISVATSSISELEVVPYDLTGQYIAFSTSPHNFTNLNQVSLSGFNTSVDFLQGSFNIGVKTESVLLAGAATTIGATGIVTYFGISGSLSNDLLSMRENDILGIGTETIKVLQVDRANSRLRVLRAQESTMGSAHTAGSVITEDSRKFTFKASRENDVKFELNKEIYFEPKEALGIGTLTGVGIGTTISFSNPGAGITQIFIQTEAIYLPNHDLKTGDIVNYKTNTGDAIGVSTDGVTLYSLPTDAPLYVGKISNDLVGIQTFQVGIGSTGTFVGIASTTVNRGLLRLTGIGTGVYHSFKTVKNNVVTGEVFKNTVTVATASTHGLKFNDNVIIDVQPGIGTTVTVKYNDFNRRIVFDPKPFVAGNVDTTNNTITISNHGFKSGDKVIHTATSAAGGLEDEKIYYIFRYSQNKVKLCLTRYQSEQFAPEFINITSASAGTLSPINPLTNVYKNNTVRFDLSDSSLATFVGITSYSAFDLNLYTDKEFNNKFYSTSSSNTFEVNKKGEVGITTDAGLLLSVTKDIPEVLYYKFDTVNEAVISEVKKEIIVDKEVAAYNQIGVKNSLYSGTYEVVGIGSTTTFTYDVNEIPERPSYSESEASLEYSTDSNTAYGGISDIEMKYKGSGYSEIVGVSSIITGVGTDSILEPSSTTIGQIVSTEIENIGFNYSGDNTVRPVSNLPEILQIESLTSFNKIGISSAGKNYTIAPTLVVLDGYTGKQVDVDLEYEIGDQQVTILQNTKGIYNTPPTIIPTGNVNGIGINTITYDSSTQDVTIGLNTAFSDSSPFSVGDKVLIENISVGVGTTGYGYNSSQYDYSLFTLTAVNVPLGGGVGFVTYSLAGLLPENAYPGNQDVLNSAGSIIPEKYFPQFDIELKKNNFIKGERVTSGHKVGEVESWNNQSETLKISSSDEFDVGDLIIGNTSHTQGTIDTKINFESDIKIEAGSIVRKGWERETGFLNNNLQRLPDNFYYQNFSYALKSAVSLDKWDEAVDTLDHPSGFLKFSDLVVESTDSKEITAKDSDLVAFIDAIGVVDVNCYPSFDLVTENSLSITDNKRLSDQIYFNSRVLTDYYESVGNRVLTIDDFSTSFNSDPRPTRFSVVDDFPIKHRSKKFFTLVKDKTFTGERQTMLVSLLHNDGKGYMNQYGRVESVTDLGSFDFNISGSKGQLLFYPTKYTVNNYNVSAVSFDIIGFANTTGIGSTTLGNFVNINSTQTAVPTGTATTIVGIASTYRSSKVLVMVNADNGRMEYDELNIIHNGTDVDLLEYGQITTDDTVNDTGAGLGTYTASMATGDIIVQFVPHTGIAASVDTLRVSIADTASGSTGIGTQWIGHGNQELAFIDSSYTKINASGSPTENLIAQYDINNTVGTNDHNGAYYIISVEDITNDRYEMSEVIVLNDASQTYITEYGNLATVAGLGTVGAAVSSTWTNLYYTPNASIDVQVRVFQMSLQIAAENDAITSVDEIDLTNAAITGGYGTYEGTEIDVLRAFNLTHDGRNIFAREFDGSDSSVVNLTKNEITIPEHFFVTGEEVSYAYDADSGSAIGIATTTITGIGTTTLLPSTLYAVKVNETTLQFAKTAEDALKTTPSILHLTSVGVGAAHTITARNQNTKCLIGLDNIIQQPIVSTAVTTGITSALGVAEVVLKVSGITSIFGGNLLKIDEEIMKVNTVGYGTTNHILVDRAWMGTGLGIHTENSIVTKVEGNYNIIDNTINFVTAPQGPSPISSTTNEPDDRDWVGITTFSTFQGRTFMRGAAADSSNRPYATNQIFDDISEGFTGVGKTFTLKSDGSNAVGFSTNNGVILVNGIFQGPTGGLSTYQDYILSEGSGITTITFTGTASSLASDPNNSNIPVGGVVASVGSTGGFGYQPLVSAGGTVIVSSAGTVSSISIGNSGSGYRVGVQTVVNVAIQTGTNVQTTLIGIGTAAITDGHITGIAITNNQVIYAPRAIYDVGYTSTTGITTITTTTAHGLLVGQEVKVSGIAFTCDYLPAVGVQSASYDSTTGIMTVTTSTAHGLTTSATGSGKNVVLSGLAFTCALDSGAATHSYPRTSDPAYGGTPVTGVASVTQFTVNVGTSTVPTFYASGGYAQPALIAPRDESGAASGTDPAASGSLVLTVGNTTSFTINSGISTRAHFYSRGGTVNRQMDVIIDDPLSYTNIPLVYSPSGTTGIGTQATVDIIVGQGSSVTKFEIKNTGYGYQDDQVLTVPKMGTTGIPTDPSLTFEEFQITIQDVATDSFAGWTFGQLEVLDKIQSEFNGSKRIFTLKKDGSPITIRAREGSNIDVQSTILVFLNDTLQVPGDGYTLTNGSILTFAEAPKGRETDGSFAGDTCKILFYKGSGDVDVTFKDVLKTVKKGDTLQIGGDADLCANSIKQDKRLVEEVISTDIVNTNAYTGVGINGDPSCKRSVSWCKQGVDKIINGQIISKSREELEALINPTTFIIQSVGVGSTVIFVESVRTFFDPSNEDQTSAKTQKISITSQDNIVGASATAVVSAAGTISAVTVSMGGTGYTSAPNVIIGTPVGLGTTTRASVTSTLTGDAVSAITVTSPGTGYTNTSVPEVLIEVPSVTREINDSSTYEGDFGEIVGVGTTCVGVASTGIVFDMYIPTNSFLRDTDIVGSAVTISGIQTGYYFTVSNSNIGNGVTSIYQNRSVLGIGTTFLDNVYEVAAVSVAQTSVPGIANTYVARVTTSVSSFNSLSGVGVSELFGNFSWGRITLGGRPSTAATSFTAYTQKGFTGISTSAVVSRVTPLKSENYSA